MLRPVAATLYLDYKCPNCSSIHQMTLKEVKEIGKVLCYCDRVLVFEQFKANLKLDYISKDKPVEPRVIEKPKGEASKESAPHNRNEIIQALFNLGWSKSEARRIIAQTENDNMSNETLLQKCLSVFAKN